MAQLIAYLTFNGNCREAMHFYQDCLGGELSLQTLGESPLADQLPVRMRHYVLHASLQQDTLRLMGTDMVGEQGFTRGNTVAVLIECRSPEEMKTYYERLSEGGQRTHTITSTFWGAQLGGLTDKYGNHWLLHLDPP